MSDDEMCDEILPVESTPQSSDIASLKVAFQQLGGNRIWHATQDATGDETNSSSHNDANPAKPLMAQTDADSSASEGSDQLKKMKEGEHGEGVGSLTANCC